MINIKKEDMLIICEERFLPSSSFKRGGNLYRFSLGIFDIFEFVLRYEWMLLDWATGLEQSAYQEDIFCNFTYVLNEIYKNYSFFNFTVFNKTKEFLLKLQPLQHEELALPPAQLIINHLRKPQKIFHSTENYLQSRNDFSNKPEVIFLNAFKTEIQNRGTLKEVYDSDNHREYAQRSFDEIIKKEKEVQIICIDVIFANDYTKTFSEFILSILPHFPLLIDIILESSEQILDLHTALLPTGDYELNLHCVFILKVDKHLIEEDNFFANLDYQIGQHDGLQLNHVNWKLINWSDIVRKKYDLKAVDVITVTDQKAIDACKDWIISPVYSLRSIFNFSSNNEAQEILFKILASKRQHLESLREKKQYQQQILQQIEKSLLTNLKVPYQASKYTVHLTEESQIYLKAAQCIYLEYDKSLELIGQPNLLRDKLYVLEVFLETLKYSNARLVQLPQHLKIEDLTASLLERYLTRLGKIWNELCYPTSTFMQASFFLRLPIASNNIKIFVQFLENYSLRFNSTPAINKYNFPALSHLMIQLRAELNKIGWKKNDYVVFNNQIKRYQAYFETILSGEVIVFRLDIQGNSDNTKITQKALSEIFTSWIRVGKQAQPLCWLKGYLIRWDQDVKPVGQQEEEYSRQYGDITLVFEKNDKNYNLDLMSMMQDYLKRVGQKTAAEKKIETEVEQKATFTTDEFLKVELVPKTIWASITDLDFNGLNLEKQNRVQKAVLVKNYLLALKYLDLFILTESLPPKRFTTGRASPSNKKRPVKRKKKKLNELVHAEKPDILC